MTTTEQREIASGRSDFRGLSEASKWRVSDDLCLGTFDWTDWYDEKPSRARMAGVRDEANDWVAATCGG
jgi:hypothetical protein